MHRVKPGSPLNLDMSFFFIFYAIWLLYTDERLVQFLPFFFVLFLFLFLLLFFSDCTALCYFAEFNINILLSIYEIIHSIYLIWGFIYQSTNDVNFVCLQLFKNCNK